MKKFSCALFTVALFFYSCSNNFSVENNSDSTGSNTAKVDSASSSWRSLTESWTASLALKNASIMKSFYADTVLYYGDKISGEDVVKRQKAYFDAHPDYKLKLYEYVGEDKQPDGSWKIKITKRVTTDGKTADYPASLIYAKRNGIWKIVSESDDITDLKKAQAIDVKYEPEMVTLEGLIEQNTGFTPNNSGGDPKSDNKETYIVIWPSQPINVIATAAQQKEGVDV